MHLINSSSIPGAACVLGKEAISIGEFINDLASWFASAVARINFHSNQQGTLTLNFGSMVLQLSGVLEGMKRHHSIIVIGRESHYGWVLLLFNAV